MTSPKLGLVDASTARVAEALRKRAEKLREPNLTETTEDGTTLSLSWPGLADEFDALASELEASGTEKRNES